MAATPAVLTQVLALDTGSRFRWTPALHQAFEAAAQELGGNTSSNVWQPTSAEPKMVDEPAAHEHIGTTSSQV